MKYIWLIFFSFVFLALCVYRIDSVNAPIKSNADNTVLRTVVLDAGHGGEDGGAVAKDNTNEKDINLVITNTIAAYFRLFGVPYVTVRTEDISVGDNSLPTVKQRKTSDIRNREKLVNSIPNAVFLSIHQNMYADSSCHGTQVFYSANREDSSVLAECIRQSVIGALQCDNTRQIKPSGSSIYLLYKAKTTAVLCECGFLSNEDELKLLKNSAYQQQMAYFIFKGTLQFLTNAKET